MHGILTSQQTCPFFIRDDQRAEMHDGSIGQSIVSDIQKVQFRAMVSENGVELGKHGVINLIAMKPTKITKIQFWTERFRRKDNLLEIQQIRAVR